MPKTLLYTFPTSTGIGLSFVVKKSDRKVFEALFGTALKPSKKRSKNLTFTTHIITSK